MSTLEPRSDQLPAIELDIGQHNVGQNYVELPQEASIVTPLRTGDPIALLKKMVVADGLFGTAFPVRHDPIITSSVWHVTSNAKATAAKADAKPREFRSSDPYTPHEFQEAIRKKYGTYMVADRLKSDPASLVKFPTAAEYARAMFRRGFSSRLIEGFVDSTDGSIYVSPLHTYDTVPHELLHAHSMNGRNAFLGLPSYLAFREGFTELLALEVVNDMGIVGGVAQNAYVRTIKLLKDIIGMGVSRELFMRAYFQGDIVDLLNALRDTGQFDRLASDLEAAYAEDVSSSRSKEQKK